jgi:trans-2,3-dihydro-3-hydroxyanthranilate isomerase
MTYQFHIADVFTDKAFGGNQLAVLPDARGLNDEQMQSITREFNFSETIFVFPPENPAHTKRVRIFTPGGELTFAGHPTVGVAYVLAAFGEIPLDGAETRIVLEEGVGPVPVSIRAEAGKPVFTQLTTAKIPEKGGKQCDPDEIAAILSLNSADINVGGEHEIEAWSVGLPFLYIPLKTLDALGRARTQFDRWERYLGDGWASELFIFVEEEASATRAGAKNGEGVMRARMFSPRLGIPEDAATGSACAAFAGYLSARSTKRDGTLKWTVHQGVEMGRPSRLDVESDVVGGEVKSVRVGGSTVLIASGTLHIP